MVSRSCTVLLVALVAVTIAGCASRSKFGPAREFDTYYVGSRSEVEEIQDRIVAQNVGAGDFVAMTYSYNTRECPGGELIRYDFGVNLVLCPKGGFRLH